MPRCILLLFSWKGFYGAGGLDVSTSACLGGGGHNPEVCCLVGRCRGLLRGESIDILGVLCRMVRSLVAMVGGSLAMPSLRCGVPHVSYRELVGAVLLLDKGIGWNSTVIWF